MDTKIFSMMKGGTRRHRWVNLCVSSCSHVVSLTLIEGLLRKWLTVEGAEEEKKSPSLNGTRRKINGKTEK